MGKNRPTEEQYHAIKTAGKGVSFVLDAPAGSGKTATALGMATQIDGRVLYLVYNRPAKDSAAKKFAACGLHNVAVRTTASLGWRYRAKTHADRMDPQNARRVQAKETAEIAGITKPLRLGGKTLIGPTAIASMAVAAIETYCRSADDEITPAHVRPETLPEGLGAASRIHLSGEVAAWAWKIWKQAIQPDSQHRYPMLYALKELTLTDPQLGCDTVLVDEAQDSNEAVYRLVSGQKHTQKIIVGDPGQAINAWNGACNIMSRFDGPRLQLTQSFRFGERVAEEARKWLEHTGTGITIKGLPSLDSIVTDAEIPNPDMILCRTNAETMKQAMTQLDQGRRVAVIGGTAKLESLAYAASKLRKGEPTFHPELAAFSNWAELSAYAEEPGGGDLKVLVRLINVHGVPEIVGACKRLTSERSSTPPDVMVSTTHKVKGMEADAVQIGGDFDEPDPVEGEFPGEMKQGRISTQDAMLGYVAITRPKRLMGRGSLAYIDDYSKVGV